MNPFFEMLGINSPPAWLLCPNCDDFFCVIHGQHVYDCECPPIEQWAEWNIDPYSNGSSAQYLWRTRNERE